MSTSKRRRYTRYEINLEATLVTDDDRFIPCVVRDFCSGGMFIELKHGNSSQSLDLKQKIQIQFNSGLEHEVEEYSIELHIMHINSIGLGVAFEGNSEDAFKILKIEAQKNTKLASSDRRYDPINIEKQEKLDADLASLMQEALPIIIKNFYHQIKVKLEEPSEEAEHYQYQVVLSDADTNLKINKDTVFENFCTLFKHDSILISSTPFDQIDETVKESSLSLIEKNDFEDWLNLSTIIRNLDSSFEKELESLLEKMAYILEVDSTMLLNPLSPEKICGRFRDSLTDIEENDQTKRCLYILFEESLGEYLGELYEKMDAILLAHGAPKKIIPKTFKKTSLVTNSETNPSFSQNDNDSIQQIIDDSVESNSEPTTVEAELLPPIHSSVSTEETRKIVSVASNLIGLLQEQNAPSQTPTAIIAEDSREVYSAKEISKALEYLQQNTIKNGSQDVSTHNFQEELQSALTSSSSLQKQLSSSDKKNLEVYESLFEILFNDQLVTQESQSYLKSIQIPIMAQAMQDNGFLESENHPTRNIVNHLFWLESAIKGDHTTKSNNVRQAIEKLIEKISNEGLENPAIFSTVEQKLDEITQSVNKSITHNIKRLNETYEGKQKLEKARQFVQEEVNHLFVGKNIPKIVVSLLDAGWQHLLVIDKLHEDNNTFQNHLGIFSSLINWLTGRKKPRIEVAENVLEYIDEQLRLVCTNTFLHTRILRDLNDLLLNNSLDPGSDAMETVTLDLSSIDKMGQARSHLDEIDYLNVGEWLMILVKEEFEPLKLAWIGESQDLFVFVNRAGIKKLEVEREDLADLIKNGSANKIESLDMPAMDRASNMMLQNLQQKLIYSATRDPITDVYNRKEFIKQLKFKLTNLENAKYLLCNIEIQDFRIITNACGLSGGDALLKQIADQLKTQLRTEDIFARLDDKTFSILLKNCSAEVAKKLQSELIDSEFVWEDKSYAIAVGMGIVPLFSGNSYDTNSVLQKADSATISAIEAGRNRIQVYKDDDESLKSQYNAHEWVGRINQVFAENRLFLRCQQIAAIDPEKGGHVHYEILLGIKDEHGNTIAPDDFIPAVERCQRMSEVDQWVVLNVFDWIENHQDIFEKLDGFSINLSGESMNSEDFLEFLKETLSSSKVPLEKITFEITETVAAGSFQFIQSFIKKIKRFKCKFSLDDFGSGYSSYSYIKSLDVDYLKIDGIFVKDIVNSSTDKAIVKSMNEIGHSLNMKTIAEYVENEEILAFLKTMGVDYAQGWGVEKPKLITDLI